MNCRYFSWVKGDAILCEPKAKEVDFRDSKNALCEFQEQVVIAEDGEEGDCDFVVQVILSGPVVMRQSSM